MVIVGSGPYGLSAAAHLGQIKGLDVAIFGEAMSFWEQNMPAGMFLRSAWTASHIADPHGSFTLEAYQSATGDSFSHPVPLGSFVRYGQWYQRKAVPQVDARKIARVASHPRGFQVTTADGENLIAGRVVIAAGINSFAWRPQEFSGLPSSLVSHTSEHCDFRRFAGKRVVVIGGGQSALESAALLHETGAEAEVITRSPRIHWLQGWLSKTLHRRLGTFTKEFLYAPTDVGPAGISQLMARPDLLMRLPRRLQDKLRKRAVRPAGARWLVARLRNVPIALGSTAVRLSVCGERVRISLEDGTDRMADHVLLGTGYHVDVSRYPFLDPPLASTIDRCNGYPRLHRGFETSLPGLHFLGAPAVWSFGPLMQFVSGTRYASRALHQAVVEKN